MKPLKFKAYVREYDRIVEVEQLELLANGEAQSIVVADWELTDETYRFTKGQFELMQYTGLKDKNGKEIYEGDIVSLKYLYDKRTTDKGQVVWREDKASFGLKSLKGLTNEVYELYKVTAEHNLEIIGNIYENPELLKG